MAKPPDSTGLKPDFDPTKELWDRLGDALEKGRDPCFETVEDLLKESCAVPLPGEGTGEK